MLFFFLEFKTRDFKKEIVVLFEMSDKFKFTIETMRKAFNIEIILDI